MQKVDAVHAAFDLHSIYGYGKMAGKELDYFLFDRFLLFRGNDFCIRQAQIREILNIAGAHNDFFAYLVGFDINEPGHR